ncbi:hypothetical protein [Chitinimonas sp. BJYL2]|uniref:hypothetical protein n=1 Tax=Chitinimonas sp. BJYL2 TaxID=2976696 RepID=UPI0022B3548F|nr:hypothetical protein [Chitinimonas sp. BJYL2]
MSAIRRFEDAMLPFFQDAFDLARFRVKPLEHYAYDWWQPIAWLTTLAILPVLLALGKTGNPLGMLAFSLAASWGQALLFTFFFAWWIRKHPQTQIRGSLFPLVVLASSAQLSGLLLSITPEMLVPLVFLGLLVYQFAVLLNALAKTHSLPVRYMVNGLMVYLAGCFALSVLIAMLLIMAGVEMPQLPAAPANAPATAQGNA